MTTKSQSAVKRAPPPEPALTFKVSLEDADTPVKRAWARRAFDAMTQALRCVDEASFEKAVSAPTNAGAVVRAMSEVVAFGDPEESDPLAESIARGAQKKEELITKAGGALAVSEVAKLLRISRQAVDKRRRGKKLVAIKRGAEYAYPACQFEKGDVVAEIPSVLALLGDQEWMALEFFLTWFEELDGHSPLEVLSKTDEALKAEVTHLARIASGNDLG